MRVPSPIGLLVTGFSRLRRKPRYSPRIASPSAWLEGLFLSGPKQSPNQRPRNRGHTTTHRMRQHKITRLDFLNPQGVHWSLLFYLSHFNKAQGRAGGQWRSYTENLFSYFFFKKKNPQGQGVLVSRETDKEGNWRPDHIKGLSWRSATTLNTQ